MKDPNQIVVEAPPTDIELAKLVRQRMDYEKQYICFNDHEKVTITEPSDAGKKVQTKGTFGKLLAKGFDAAVFWAEILTKQPEFAAVAKMFIKELDPNDLKDPRKKANLVNLKVESFSLHMLVYKDKALIKDVYDSHFSMLVSSLDFIRHSRFCDSRIKVNEAVKNILDGSFKLETGELRKTINTFT